MSSRASPICRLQVTQQLEIVGDLLSRDDEQLAGRYVQLG
jgi:hypothetical protein